MFQVGDKVIRYYGPGVAEVLKIIETTAEHVYTVLIDYNGGDFCNDLFRLDLDFLDGYELISPMEYVLYVNVEQDNKPVSEFTEFHDLIRNPEALAP